MSRLFEDSDRFCPRLDCGKRMVVDIGQDDTDFGSGWVEMWHLCLACDYREKDTSWKRSPVVEVARSASGHSAAELLLAQRNGWVVPLAYSTEAFPTNELDLEVTSDVR